MPAASGGTPSQTPSPPQPPCCPPPGPESANPLLPLPCSPAPEQDQGLLSVSSHRQSLQLRASTQFLHLAGRRARWKRSERREKSCAPPGTTHAAPGGRGRQCRRRGAAGGPHYGKGRQTQSVDLQSDTHFSSDESTRAHSHWRLLTRP